LVHFLSHATDTTTLLITRIDHAGTPKVMQGSALARFIHNNLKQVAQLFASSAKRARALPNDLQGFSSAAQQLGNSIDNAAPQIQTVFSSGVQRFQGAADLDRSFNADPACRSI
jgi:hypothetical protein